MQLLTVQDDLIGSRTGVERRTFGSLKRRGPRYLRSDHLAVWESSKDQVSSVLHDGDEPAVALYYEYEHVEVKGEIKA